MSTDILAIVIAVIVGGIVTIAWRIRTAVDKGNEGLRVPQPVTPKGVGKSQMQTSIEGLENKQAELSKTPDRISETKPTAAKPKVVKKKVVKKKTVKTSPRKTVSKPKKKKA
jgi:hypothetical protein